MDESEYNELLDYATYLLLNESLYKNITIDFDNIAFFKEFLEYKLTKQFDCYCIHCKKDSTFKSKNDTELISYSNIFEKQLDNLYGKYGLVFQCQRCSRSEYIFVFLVDDYSFRKIGQYPSLADLQLHDIKKYRKILKDDYREFSKAIGLFANNIGIGSFVYLRRIFENLIYETYKESELEIEKFESLRMNEKVKVLKNYLPDVISELPQLYAIISKGIHELSEEKCKEIFPQLKVAIELILDEKLAAKEENKKITELKSFISTTATEINQAHTPED